MHALYTALMIIAAPFILPVFLVLLLLRPRYRAGVRERLGLLPDSVRRREEGKAIWFHAVSVGEVEAVLPLIRAVREKHPEYQIVLSTVTETGHRVARKKIPERDHLIYFPFDFLWIPGHVIERVRPSLFVFLETEIWPHLLFALGKRDIPSLLVNGRISLRSFRRYRMVRPFVRSVLAQVNCFSMQTHRDADLIKELGADPLRVIRGGNMKYDGAVISPVDGAGSQELRDELGLRDGRDLFIAGSTHEGEEEEILSCYQDLLREKEDLVLMIASRHLERIPRMEALISERGLMAIRKTEIGSRGLPVSDKGVVILLDTLGELARYYHAASVVFIGGSFVPIGGHNLMEAAGCGKVVFFGPHVEHVAEMAQRLLAHGCGIQVRDGKDLATRMSALMKRKDLLQEMGKKAREVVQENQGAVARNLELISRLLKERERSCL